MAFLLPSTPRNVSRKKNTFFPFSFLETFPPPPPLIIAYRTFRSVSSLRRRTGEIFQVMALPNVRGFLKKGFFPGKEIFRCKKESKFVQKEIIMKSVCDIAPFILFSTFRWEKKSPSIFKKIFLQLCPLHRYESKTIEFLSSPSFFWYALSHIPRKDFSSPERVVLFSPNLSFSLSVSTLRRRRFEIKTTISENKFSQLPQQGERGRRLRGLSRLHQALVLRAVPHRHLRRRLALWELVSPQKKCSPASNAVCATIAPPSKAGNNIYCEFVR